MVRPSVGPRLSGVRADGRYPLPNPIEEEGMRRLVFVLVGVLALMLAACSSDDGGGTTASTGATAATGSNAGETRDEECADLTGEGAMFTITIANFAYDPPCFTVSAQQGNKIVNKYDVDHKLTIT